VGALLARAAERRLVILVSVEDRLLLHDGVAVLVGDPARRSGDPTRIASRILLPAIADVAASKSIGASRPAGAASAIGLVPRSGFAANVGTTLSPAPVKQTPTMSWSAACIA